MRTIAKQAAANNKECRAESVVDLLEPPIAILAEYDVPSAKPPAVVVVVTRVELGRGMDADPIPESTVRFNVGSIGRGIEGLAAAGLAGGVIWVVGKGSSGSEEGTGEEKFGQQPWALMTNQLERGMRKETSQGKGKRHGLNVQLAIGQWYVSVPCRHH
ncbi:hypothetical protein Droror1_Dr00021193 [Drosera rotundifolia]